MAGKAPAADRASAWLGLLVEGVVRRPRAVAALVLLASAAAAVFAGARFEVDTDRDAMLSPELGFQREAARIDALFPGSSDELVLIVDGETSESARATALALAAELEGRPDLFGSVLVPLAHPFLEEHGLLLMPLEDLRQLASRLAAIQPFLGRLARDQSLAGLFSLLESAWRERREEPERGAIAAAELERVGGALASALDPLLGGPPRAPLSWQELFAEPERAAEQRRQYVLASCRLAHERVFSAGAAMSFVRELLAREGLAGDRGDQGSQAARVRLTGGVALAHEELETVLSGADRIALCVLVLVGAVLCIALRSLRMVLCVVVTLLAGLCLTAAFAMATVGHFNLISIAFAALYLGLAVDYALHLGLRAVELARAGASYREALPAATRDVGGSLLLCALTTSLGFFSFVPTAYRGVSELGWIAGAGMFIGLALALLLFPALVAWLVPAPAAGRPARARARRLGEWLSAHRRAVLASSALFALASTLALPAIAFDANPLNLRDPHSESVRAFRELLRTSETPPWSATVLAQDRPREAELALRLAELPEVGRVLSSASFLPEAADEKGELLRELELVLGTALMPAPVAAPPAAAERAAAQALAAELELWLASPAGAADAPARALCEALHALAEALAGASAEEVAARARSQLFAELAPSLARLSRALAAEPYALEALPADLAGRWIAPGGVRRVEAYPAQGLDLERAGDLERFVRAVQGVAPSAAGGPIVMYESGRAVVRAFQQALALALVAIGLLVLALLRRVGDAVLVLLPLCFAALLSAATMVLLGLRFDFASIIALPLLLGIGVDSGVHLVHRARAGNPRAAEIYASSTARGVLFSALTTLVSFANLALSPHPGTAGMGLTLAVALCWTLVGSLVLLPAVLARPQALVCTESSAR